MQCLQLAKQSNDAGDMMIDKRYEKAQNMAVPFMPKDAAMDIVLGNKSGPMPQ